MSARLLDEETQVPLDGNEDVTLSPGLPWPSAYRGSKYSVIDSYKHNRLVLAWQYQDLQIYLDPPEGLIRALQSIGKSAGAGSGSIRITAAGEILTKVWAEDYEHLGMAPVTDGWVPVYVGKFEGDLGFTDVDVDPGPLGDGRIAVWEGLPFHHGERWAVSYDRTLIWKYQGYYFESAFEHPELIQKYAEFRTTPGRVYVNEYGHIWGNVPTHEVPGDKQDDVHRMFSDWRREAQELEKTSILRLVNRRLTATGGGDPERGHLPVHLGHISEFDAGVLPRTVVDDVSYFVESGSERED